MKQWLWIAGALLALSPLTAQAQAPKGLTPLSDMPSGTYIIDPAHASVTWKVSHLGLSNYTARFAKVDATLIFDAKDPTKSGLIASVDPLSIRTDFPNPTVKDFDKELATGADWFNATKYPHIKFSSGTLKKTGENTGTMQGLLTMLGVSKQVKFDVTFNGAYLKKPFAETPALGFSAKGKIKRSDWGFGTYVPMIGDEVEIIIEAEFNKQADTAPTATKN